MLIKIGDFTREGSLGYQPSKQIFLLSFLFCKKHTAALTGRIP